MSTLSETPLSKFTVVAALPTNAPEASHVTMTAGFCCFSSPGMLTFFDWALKTSVTATLPDGTVGPVIGLCCCQSKGLDVRRVFGLTAGGQLFCWRYDPESANVPVNLVHTYDAGTWPQHDVAASVAYLVADERADLVVVILPNKFLHVFSLRLNETMPAHAVRASDQPSGLGSLVRSALQLAFKPLQHFARSSSDTVCNMWTLPGTDVDEETDEITMCMGTETFLDVWKVDVDRATGALSGSAWAAGAPSTLRVPTSHKSWITAIASRQLPPTYEALGDGVSSVVVTGDAGGGLVVWTTSKLPQARLRADWHAKKKAAEEEAAAEAKAKADAEAKAHSSSSPSRARKHRSHTPDRRAGSPAKEANGAAAAGKSKAASTGRGESRSGQRPPGEAENDAAAPEGPAEPDDATSSGLDEHIVALGFGASGPVTVVHVDTALDFLWVADASGAITGASMDVVQRAVVRMRRLAVDLGWAAELLWQHDSAAHEGTVRYVEGSRGVVMECVVHDRVNKVFQTASSLDSPNTNRHRTLVSCCALLPEWGLLLTGGFSPAVDVWDVDTGQLVCTLDTPTKQFTALAVRVVAHAATDLASPDAGPPGPSAHLLTGHGTGEVHAFRLSLAGVGPTRVAAALAHTAIHSPMAVTDIFLSKSAAIAALCFARMCIVLHDCETNMGLRELNFESPIDCIQTVTVADLSVLGPPPSAPPVPPSRPGKESRAASRLKPRTAGTAGTAGKSRGGIRRRKDDHLVLALHSRRMATVIDLLGSGDVLTAMEFVDRSDSWDPTAVVGGAMWQQQQQQMQLPPEGLATAAAATTWVGVCVSLQRHALNYLPDVVCYRKHGLAAGPVEAVLVTPPPASTLGAGRRLVADAVDAIAQGIEVTHIGGTATSSTDAPALTIAAVWTLRKVFFVRTPTWAAGADRNGDGEENGDEDGPRNGDAELVHACVVVDRKVHVVLAKVLPRDAAPNDGAAVSDVLLPLLPQQGVGPEDGGDVAAVVSSTRVAAIIVLSDGNTLTIHFDVPFTKQREP